MNERLFLMSLIKQSQTEEHFIKGELVHQIFHNSEESFSIAKIRILETNESFSEDEIVVKGYFPILQSSESYVFYGQLIRHPKFGMQYDVERYKTYIPNSEEGLIDYLSSDLFYGIGPKTAENIVSHLGNDAIEKILLDETVLDDVPQLNQKTKDVLIDTLKAHQGFEHVVVYLRNYDIGLKMAHRIYKQYEGQTVALLEEDPYQFVYDIEGFGFQTADKIATQNGLQEDHPNRIGAAGLYVLQRASQEGHVFLPIDLAIDRIIQLLHPSKLESKKVKQTIHSLHEDEIVIVDQQRIYLPSLYYAEVGIKTALERILATAHNKKTDMAHLLKLIGEIEEKEYISYGKEQFKAIEKALESKIMILTGGPGTGKTTVVKGIIETFKKVHDLAEQSSDTEGQVDNTFLLAAPTGRAAKRLAQSTGMEAMTIHRLLGWDGHDGFSKNEEEKLSGKMLIIDEFSMVDTWLAYHLLRAVPNDMPILIVGDEDQLPSVGPGQVLRDLLVSSKIPSVTLKEVYRQKEGSKIIELAHLMKEDKLQKGNLTNAKDFSFIPCDENHLTDAVVKIYGRALEKGIDPEDFQVLVPIYRSKNGINEMNKQLQNLANPFDEKKREVAYLDVIFRIGDKVLQLTNQPEDGIYNGDIGQVVAIFKPNENTEKVEQLVVLFDDKEVIYERKDYKNIQHAYCISIHKSQGSEFKNVLLPVASSYMRMLKKNLLYTAMTRSEESLIICGNVDAFIQGVKALDINTRFTFLQERLGGESTSHFKDSPWPIRIPLTEAEKKEDSNLTPYDFM